MEEEKAKPNKGNGFDLDTHRWTQTLSSLEVMVPIGGDASVPLKGKMLDVEVKVNHIRVGLKGQPPIIDADLSEAVKTDATLWTIDGDKREVNIELEKAKGMSWWSRLLTTDPEIDTQKVVPEDSKLSDLDENTRPMVEKMMHDQRQKEKQKSGEGGKFGLEDIMNFVKGNSGESSDLGGLSGLLGK